MSRHTSIRNLQIITALDSLSYGLIYRFIPMHLLKLGSDHVMVGVLMVGTLIGELLSPEITKIFTQMNGKRRGLVPILSLALLDHLMMAMSTNSWFTLLMWVLFSAINTQNVFLSLLLDREPNLNSTEKLHVNFNVLSGSGYILGPIIGGYLFDKEKGFCYISMLAAFLTLTNILLLTTLDQDHDDNCECLDDDDKFSSLKRFLREKVDGLQKCDLKKNWDILLLKYSFASSFLILFSKISQVLNYNYEGSSSITVGYTIAHMNALVFASIKAVFEAKPYINQYPLLFTTELAFFLLTILLTLACYAPSHELLLLLLIPIIFLRSLIMTLWKDLFQGRKNEDLNKLNTTAGVMAGITIPLLFGVICNYLAHHAVILFTCIPVLLCWATVRFYSRFLKTDVPIVEGEGNNQEKVKFL